MATTYTLISSNVLTSSAASVTFSSIPSTYTDLVLRVSARDTTASSFQPIYVEMNSTNGIYSRTRIFGNGSTVSSNNATAETKSYLGSIDAANNTSNTFASVELYIPNYAGTAKKPYSSFAATEDNATASNINVIALLADLTSAINQLVLTTNTSFASGSSFYLYGIKNS